MEGWCVVTCSGGDSELVADAGEQQAADNAGVGVGVDVVGKPGGDWTAIENVKYAFDGGCAWVRLEVPGRVGYERSVQLRLDGRLLVVVAGRSVDGIERSAAVFVPRADVAGFRVADGIVLAFLAVEAVLAVAGPPSAPVPAAGESILAVDAAGHVASGVPELVDVGVLALAAVLLLPGVQALVFRAPAVPFPASPFPVAPSLASRPPLAPTSRVPAVADA